MAADLQSHLDAYADALASFRDLAADLRDEEWGLPTECPGWTVRDQVAHVLALELQLGGHPAPPPLPDYGDHVRSPAGRHMEDGIAALRDLTPAQLVTRLGEAAGAHLARLRQGPLDEDATVVGILGTDVPLGRFLPVRVFDVWAHEQDVRRATGRRGNLAGPAAEVSVGQVRLALPYLVGTQVAPPTGTSVAVEVSGETPFATTVTVGQDGRAGAVDGVAGDASATLRMRTETLTRLACGRVDPATAPVEVHGDESLARRVLQALVMTP